MGGSEKQGGDKHEPVTVFLSSANDQRVLDLTYRMRRVFAPGQKDVLEAENGRKVVRGQAEPVAWGSRTGVKGRGDER